MPWYQGMTFDQIRQALDNGTAPLSRVPGAFIEVPDGFLSWRSERLGLEPPQSTPPGAVILHEQPRKEETDPRGAPTKCGAESVVIQKTRFTASGWHTSLYACGPVRETLEEARDDAKAFASLDELRRENQRFREALQAVVDHAPPDDDLSDPQMGRWIGDSAMLLCHRALGLVDDEAPEAF